MARFHIFQLERYLARWEFAAPLPFCCSDCESVSVSDLEALDPGLKERMAALRLGYTETRGAYTLREAVSVEYPGASPDEIFVHSGAEEAVLNLCLALCSAGDRVIVNLPCYQSLAEVPRSLGCEVVPWEWREEGSRWRLDPDDLERLIRSGPDPRLVILNAPHNPTGGLPTRDEFEAIVSAARRVGAVVLLDEVYRRLERDPARRLPSIRDAYENGVALDALSKHAGLAGVRIGWLASRRTDILDAVAVVKDYNSICASAPSELLAESAVRNLSRLVERNLRIAKSNLESLRAFFAERPGFACWTEPEGSSVAFPRLVSTPDAETVAGRLVRDAG
ncbi:MAG TPA: aminotransferase class I/II-fold pyridoxal phosphate-dependent enzyme, partial [Magnetospirillaceae bacterium]|nr:aminotransferase class I/II-fold pyridoxal phosphate-dependent enzyme [Magnetospirillaceae bacterium]